MNQSPTVPDPPGNQNGRARSGVTEPQTSGLYAATGPVTVTRTRVPGMGTDVPETLAVTNRPEARTWRWTAASCPK